MNDRTGSLHRERTFAFLSCLTLMGLDPVQCFQQLSGFVQEWTPISVLGQGEGLT